MRSRVLPLRSDMASLSFRLALAEIRHWKLSALCQVFLIAGIVAPVMLMHALQTGVMADLRAYFEATPDNLRLHPTQSFTRDQTWFDRWSKDPQIGFLAPHPYENAVELSIDSDRHRNPIDTVILASGPGDLMLPPGVPAPSLGDVVLTASLADALDAKVGDTVRLNAFQPDPDRFSKLPLKVLAITPSSRWASDGALVSPEIMIEAWNWRRGYSSRLFGLEGEAFEGEQTFPRFRMYAKRLSDLQPLAERLRSEGVGVSGNFADAELADAIERGARSAVLIVSFGLMAGGVVALAAGLLSDAARLRPSIQLLRMDGLSSAGARAIMLWKAMLVGLWGWLIGLGLFVAGLQLANFGLGTAGLPFAASGRIGLIDVAAFGAVTVVLVAAVGAAVSKFALPRSEFEES